MKLKMYLFNKQKHQITVLDNVYSISKTRDDFIEFRSTNVTTGLKTSNPEYVVKIIAENMHRNDGYFVYDANEENESDRIQFVVTGAKQNKQPIVNNFINENFDNAGREISHAIRSDKQRENDLIKLLLETAELRGKLDDMRNEKPKKKWWLF